MQSVKPALRNASFSLSPRAVMAMTGISRELPTFEKPGEQGTIKITYNDTEENAISTEMEAVKKVIQKNVESSFKTFNA